MSPLMIGLCAFVALIVLMLLRCPIAVSMFIVGAGGLLITKGSHLAFYALSTTPYNAIFSFSLVAIPMFILLGKMMPGMLQIYHGYKEADANELVPEAHLDEYSGYPGYNCVRCRIIRDEEVSHS